MKVWNDKVLKKYIRENDEKKIGVLDKFAVHEQFAKQYKDDENVKISILPSGFTAYL